MCGSALFFIRRRLGVRDGSFKLRLIVSLQSSQPYAGSFLVFSFIVLGLLEADSRLIILEYNQDSGKIVPF